MRTGLVVGAALVMAAGGARAESPPITHVQHFTSAPGENYTASATAANTTAAVRFDMGDGTSIYYLELWFGPAAAERDVTLTIWDDTAGTLEPGTMLSQETITLTPSETLQTRSIFASGLAQKIRVGVTTSEIGPPALGLDLDGISAPDLNFIRVGDGPWQTAAEAGLSGDWVIAINRDGAGVGPEPLPPDAAEDPGDDASTDDTAATDGDGLDDEAGCCSSSAGAGGGVLLGLLVLGLLLAPRRR